LDMMNLPDGASRPMTVRMNPEMLPIMTANVYMQGIAIDELSEFARHEIAPVMEGVPGVAVMMFSARSNSVHSQPKSAGRILSYRQWAERAIFSPSPFYSKDTHFCKHLHIRCSPVMP
jgi:hypothetical protein